MSARVLRFNSCQMERIRSLSPIPVAQLLLQPINLELNGLYLPRLAPSTQQELSRILPANSQVMNPIDMLGGADKRDYANALKIIQSNPEIDNAIVIHTPTGISRPPQYRRGNL